MTCEFVDDNDIIRTGNDSVEGIMYNIHEAVIMTGEYVDDNNDIIGTDNDYIEGIMYNIHDAVIITGEFVDDNDIIGTGNVSV